MRVGKSWSGAFPRQDTNPIQARQCHLRRSVLLLPARVLVVTRCCRSLGLYCLPHEDHCQANFCLNAEVNGFQQA